MEAVRGTVHLPVLPGHRWSMPAHRGFCSAMIALLCVIDATAIPEHAFAFASLIELE